jgi:hypothetical protein
MYSKKKKKNRIGVFMMAVVQLLDRPLFLLKR